MDPIKNIGKILGQDAARDAIHIAIAPVVASQTLTPGCHVGLDDEGKANCFVANKIGIVDPYLTESVRGGQRFYLFLYPNTVTSLRHEWTHPAFGPSEPNKGMSDSELWLRNYATKVNSYDAPDEAFQRLIDGLKTRELFFHGSDLHGRYDLDDEEELRHHAERYLGTPIKWDAFSFSCSC